MPLSPLVERAVPLTPRRPPRSPFRAVERHPAAAASRYRGDHPRKRPTVAEQVRKTGAPASSALAKLIRDNQDIELLHPDELNDGYPTPLWLRVVWRKQHPEIAMPARNAGAAYPETLAPIYRRMVANPDQPWGPKERPLLSSRKGFIAALIAAVLSGVACLATLIEPQWFELLFQKAPDGGDGRLETLVAVVVSLAACLFFGLLAWRERRRGQREEAARAVIVKDLA
jgi:hypothetical protein